mmetsp:Transcript_17209/g.39421  ORF Transcript_17209/g.39421 Transcript_17209/m.39421 type:complete len:99 (-) Transcript_17209:77-373(-)
MIALACPSILPGHMHMMPHSPTPRTLRQDKSSINKQTTEAMHMSPTTTGNAPSASPTAEGDAGRGGALGLDAEDIGGVVLKKDRGKIGRCSIERVNPS